MLSIIKFIAIHKNSSITQSNPIWKELGFHTFHTQLELESSRGNGRRCQVVVAGSVVVDGGVASWGRGRRAARQREGFEQRTVGIWGFLRLATRAGCEKGGRPGLLEALGLPATAMVGGR